ncbi:MAG: fucose isomerase [Defluviitaleaceae bacterium]|nr:fucose isomerase [Defluviitaleaceae bacterium]
MKNIPNVTLGLVAVSRDCFPIELSRDRRDAVVKAMSGAGLNPVVAQTVVENEKDTLKALDELRQANANALVVYLGNFGPEGPETMLAQKFDGPVMFVAAAEENDLMNNRGDAYCGMLNASYNLGLRNLRTYIPEYPVGTPNEVAAMIAEFLPIARILIGLSSLKILSFGPRPFDFLACNAPIKPLYDLGVEIQENSELDLFASYNAHANDPRIASVVADMEKELGVGSKHPGILPKLAQYEITLLDWIENNKGACNYVTLASKCWPAFQTQFGFVPCYVNSRLASQGIPVACEADIYGALSEYILAAATEAPPTILDINNTVPKDMYESHKTILDGYKQCDLFMGFHCGNTPACHLKTPELRHQLIMKRLLEPDNDPDITRGTLEGQFKPSDVTIFRLQSTAEGVLKSYIAQGEIKDVDPQSFGGIGVIAIPEMGRFYRHVLIEDSYPHHSATAFCHIGKTLYDVLKILNISKISYNQPASLPYPTENPFCK